MELKNKVEAVLFAIGKKIDINEIARLCSASVENVSGALAELKKEYDSKQGSLIVSNVENMWKFNVKPEYLDLVRDLIKETDLDMQTMETLAMIAYLSPVMQSELIERRTPAVYDHVKELEEMGFITKVKKGRSRELRITEKFYDYFDIDKGKVKELFDKFKQRDSEIGTKENELVQLEQQRSQESEQLKKHIEENAKPLSLAEELNSLDGGVAPQDVEKGYDEMIKLREEQDKLKEQRKKELLKLKKQKEREMNKNISERVIINEVKEELHDEELEEELEEQEEQSLE